MKLPGLRVARPHLGHLTLERAKGIQFWEFAPTRDWSQGEGAFPELQLAFPSPRGEGQGEGEPTLTFSKAQTP
jgi:hypothetical protein